MSTVVIAILAAFGSGGLVALVTAIAARKRTEAETVDIVTKAADRIILALTNDNDSLRTQVRELEKQNRAQSQKIDQVNEQLRQMRHVLRRAGIDPDLAAEGEA